MFKNGPNYKNIYVDIINKKYPNKKKECEILLGKQELSTLDVIELNTKIFGTKNKENRFFNQKLRSYKQTDIVNTLEYQFKNNLNNCQLASHFNLSRNTVAKWKKNFNLITMSL